MSEPLLELSILSPERPIEMPAVRYFQVPALMGVLGIGANHTPLLAELRSGVVLVYEKSELQLSCFISGGYLKIAQNRAVILVESFNLPQEIDVRRAQISEERALKRLKEKTNLDIDLPRAIFSLERARARQALAGMAHKQGTPVSAQHQQRPQT